MESKQYSIPYLCSDKIGQPKSASKCVLGDDIENEVVFISAMQGWFHKYHSSWP